MTYSASSASVSPLGSEFNEFLFAPIGQDRNGMRLSVLSALARMDIDPWDEAAQLARLPEDAATERLASLIAAQPDGPSILPDSATVAALLIALLPRQPSPNLTSRKMTSGVGAAAHSRAIIICVYAIFMVAMLGAQWIAASRQLPVPAENAPASTSRMIIPQTQTPSPDQ